MLVVISSSFNRICESAKTIIATSTLDQDAGSLKRVVCFLSLHLVSLIIFGIIAFRMNAPYLFLGLDGSYMLTIVKQQYWWTQLDAGFTNNYFQSMGNAWFPLNAKLIPGYMVSMVSNGGEVDPVVAYEVFSVELFLSAYILGLSLRLGPSVSAMAGWGLVLSVMPYYGLAKVSGLLSLVPHHATVIATTTVFLILFRQTGRGGLIVSSIYITGMLLLIIHLAVSQPSKVMVVVPALLIFGICLLITVDSKKEFCIKLVCAIGMIGIWTIIGLPQFLLGMFEYTAAHLFSSEFINVRQDWHYVSIAFQNNTWGIGGPLFTGFALAGAFMVASYGNGISRIVARSLLFTVFVMVMIGGLTVYVDFWKGPSPVYFETMLWPFYSVFAAAFIKCLWKYGIAVAERLNKFRWRLLPMSVNGGLSPYYNLSLACLPWAILVSYQLSATPTEPLYLYPPRLTPIVMALKDEIGLIPGGLFRGRVATFTGQSIQRKVDWLDLHSLDNGLVKRLGNDHRMVGLWYYDIPTLQEYSQLISPLFYLIVRRFLARPGDHQMRSVMVLRHIDLRLLRMMGIRLFITDAPITTQGELYYQLAVGDGSVLYLYKLDRVNVGQFSPTKVILARDAHAVLNILSDPDFSPSESVVVESPLPGKLVPLDSSRVVVEPGRLRLSATSHGLSVLLLPFEYSHCLELQVDRKMDSNPRLFRANLLQAGILFAGSLDATLEYFTGPFRNAGCRLEDVWDADRLKIAAEVQTVF